MNPALVTDLTVPHILRRPKELFRRKHPRQGNDAGRTFHVADTGCPLVGGMYSRVQQMAEAAAIIQGEYIALFELFVLNCTGSNLVGGKSLGAGTRTHICMGDVRELWGLILPQYTLLLKKRLSILS
ncbi:hypothetical protein L0665_03010 [Methanogenium marinum]|uniref:Uncharacterized protein n=1 Tax=Methanogenium marinum TaxID=348610 RepID=A0A9Q4KSW7_9EURY|nr:hypothetical protein [Methanogenium marinum]MDE4907583.1 hypothetical protein [Methanogenium marinum]